MKDLSLQKILLAKRVLQGEIIETPLISLYKTTIAAGNPILIKAECLQPTGSFKIRGVIHFLSKLTSVQKKKGVISYSTGNHAQAVSWAAQKNRIPATIVMSQEAPTCKIEATKRYGGTVIFTENSSEARKLLAEEIAQQQNLTLIPPYDHPHIISGQGTIGLEIMHDTDPAAIFVPVGGGGLISGIAFAAKRVNPKVKIIGVEPELENDAWQSLKYHTKITLSHQSNTIADAICVQTLGQLNYTLMQQYVDEMLTVSETEIAEATLALIEKTHLFVEPAGALAYAGALQYKKKFSTKKPVVALASGGNTTLQFITNLNKRYRR